MKIRFSCLAGVMLAGMLGCLVASPVFAGPVTTIPGGVIVPMPAVNAVSAGPIGFGPGITWSSTDGFSVFGYTGGYGFDTNGSWTGALAPMAGLNNSGSTQTMTFAFSAPVSAVGGFLNYAAPVYGTPIIAVYDSSLSLIESSTLSFSTGGVNDKGEFHGFSEGSAIISYFTLTDAYIGLTDLTILSSVASVPEPSSLSLIGLGALGVAYGARRRRRQLKTAV